MRTGGVGPGRWRPSRSMRTIAARTAVVLCLSLLASGALAVLALGDPGVLRPQVEDVVAVLGFVLLVLGATTAVHHRTRKGAVWRSRAARWWYGALVSGVAVLGLGFVAAVVALVTPSETGEGPTTDLGVAFLVWLFVLALTGLPLWTFLFGAALGPGAPVGGAGETRHEQHHGEQEPGDVPGGMRT